LVAGLPGDLKASVFITLHVAPYSLGILPEILEQAGSLRASNAKDWERIEQGRVTRGPRENRFRPAVDTLFRSAAHAFGPRVVGVILTGRLDDGTAGLWAVKERGGTAIVQHPDDSFAPAMPLNAIKHVEVDHILPFKDIAPLLARLTETPAREEGGRPVSEEMETEVKIAGEDNALESGIMKWGDPSVYACPECHGVLLQLKEGNNMRFRCHTGHAYSVDSLLAEFTEKTEESLWSAIEEGVLLMREPAKHFGERLNGTDAEALLTKADESQRRAELVRQTVLTRERLSREKAAD
jgi:two-component system, chemotaxis family, protein-glutamate methylesterase/glutaminase